MAEAVEEARSTQSLVPRYESLIRLAEAIRSHRGQKDLFQFVADGTAACSSIRWMAQLDRATNRINWHFSEAYDSAISRWFQISQRKKPVERWVDRTQQPVVLRVANEDTRFPKTIEALNNLGLPFAIAFPLSTAHQRLAALFSRVRSLTPIPRKKYVFCRSSQSRSHWPLTTLSRRSDANSFLI